MKQRMSEPSAHWIEHCLRWRGKMLDGQARALVPRLGLPAYRRDNAGVAVPMQRERRQEERLIHGEETEPSGRGRTANPRQPC